MIYIDGKPLNVTVFPDNTSQVWKLPFSKEEIEYSYISRTPIEIKWDFTAESEFIHLAQLKDLLDHLHIGAKLSISYLPYGRQDKEVSNYSTFALRTFAKLLNSLNFISVEILDPHSEVALFSIKNSKAVYPIGKVYRALEETNSNMICYPDKGAKEKYSKVFPLLDNIAIFGEKVRDQLTGNITSYNLVGYPQGKNVLIVDDIADGGATFKLLAKELLAKGAKSVVLFVTHGIFSKGTRTLFEAGIDRVFTKDGEVSKRTSSVQL